MVGLLPDRPHRFNIVPVKILVAFLTELVEITKNLYGTAKCAEEPQQSGDREQSWRYHTNWHQTIYHKAIIIKQYVSGIETNT